MMMGGPIVAQAASATGLLVGGVSAIGAVAPSDSFLWMGGGLTVGLGVVVASSLGRIFFPASNLLYTVSMYGGLALFSGMQLYDVQRTAKVARLTPPNVQYDAMRMCIGCVGALRAFCRIASLPQTLTCRARQYLNTINIFVRMAMIFAGNGNNRRR